MTARIWFALVLSFLFYSCIVYIGSSSSQHKPPASPAANAGWKLWQAKNCHTCHQLYGLGGYMGPDLTNIASDKHKGNPDYIKTFIKYGSTSMPNLHLTDSQANELVAFLQWVDKSGKSNVSPENVHWTGTYLFY